MFSCQWKASSSALQYSVCLHTAKMRHSIKTNICHFYISASIWYLLSTAGKEVNTRVLEKTFKLNPSRSILQEHQLYSELYWFSSLSFTALILPWFICLNTLTNLQENCSSYAQCLPLKFTFWICTSLWTIT